MPTIESILYKVILPPCIVTLLYDLKTNSRPDLHSVEEEILSVFLHETGLNITDIDLPRYAPAAFGYDNITCDMMKSTFLCYSADGLCNKAGSPTQYYKMQRYQGRKLTNAEEAEC